MLKNVQLLAFILLILNACKEPEGIGLDVLPSGQEMPIAWVDTFTLEARSVFDDSVSTSNLSGTYVIGDFGDPIFGRVQSQLFTQFLLPSSAYDFGEGATLDSIILNMAYSGSYGYTDKLRGMLRFGVYQLTDDIDDDSTYYSNIGWNTDPVAVGQMDFRPDLYSSVITGEDTLPSSLRIPLSTSFGESILNSVNLSSNEDFLSEFKGLNIRSEDLSMPSGFGSILYFDMTSSLSRIELYYHNDTDTAQYLGLEINEDCATHTAFDHEFSSTVIDAESDSIITGATRLYIQSMEGLKTKVEMPFLKELNELGVIAINKAELVVPLDASIDLEHGSPNSLKVTGIDSVGNSVFLIDFVEGSSYYGGTYDPVNKEYVFNIARHLQSILNAPEEPDYGLYVLNSGNAVNARRGVFNGPEHPDSPMKLRLTYTIIE